MLTCKKLTCGKCGKKHYGYCLIQTDNCYSCGKSGHKGRDCPNLKGQDKSNGLAQASCYNVDVSKKNRFYALLSKSEQETSPNMVTSNLKVFSIDVYVLLDPGATLSFFTPLVAKKFDILPAILDEPFMVPTTWMSPLLQTECIEIGPIMLPNRVTYVEPVELDMLDFDIILGMNWSHACFASIDCRTRVVKFKFRNEPIVEGGKFYS